MSKKQAVTIKASCSGTVKVLKLSAALWTVEAVRRIRKQEYYVRGNGLKM